MITMGLKNSYGLLIAEAVARGTMTPVGGVTAKPPAGGTAAPAADLAVTLAGLAAAGFPDPAFEHRFAPPRRWRFDMCFPPQLVALEREGGGFRPVRCECGRTRTVFVSRHHSRDGLEADAEKYAEAAILGWVVIRATPPMLADGRALALVLRALTRKV